MAARLAFLTKTPGPLGQVTGMQHLALSPGQPELIVVTAPTITVKAKNATNHVGFSDRGGSTTMRS